MAHRTSGLKKIRVPGVKCRPTGRFLAILSAKVPLHLCSRLRFFEAKHTTSTLCTCESCHLDFKCGSARGGGIGYYSTTCMKGIVYLDMLIGLWRRGDGGGTVKKESKKEVETVANNYPR